MIKNCGKCGVWLLRICPAVGGRIRVTKEKPRKKGVAESRAQKKIKNLSKSFSLSIWCFSAVSRSNRLLLSSAAHPSSQSATHDA